LPDPLALSTSAGVARDRIFISYRRDDACGASGRVWDWLRIGFGRERVFRDVGSIGAGKWRQKIDEALWASKACVAVIGRRWADGDNLPRLLDPSDMVRHELETALASGEREELTVIPLLVEDAQLSGIPKDKLPESLRPLLADWNVLALSESGWDEDTRRLTETIAAATGIALRRAELEEVMALMAGGLQGLARKQVASRMDAGGFDGGVQALEALLHQVAGADPAERPALKAAMAALAEGDTRLAEEAFEQEMQNSRRLRLASEHLAAKAALVAAEERKREGDAAHNVGNLAVVRGDLEKASDYFYQALEANPDDLRAAYKLGDTWICRGNLVQAKSVFESLIEKAIEVGNQRLERHGLRGLGDVQMRYGDRSAALAAYNASFTIADTLSKGDPADTELQRELSIGHELIGNVRLKQGDTHGAIASYYACLEIREALARLDPANTAWQRHLSVCHNKIGNMLLLQGDAPSALAAYQAGLVIAETLVKTDPANTEWQRDLSVSHNKVGDVMVLQGDGLDVLAAYRESLAIRETLASLDQANMEWQRDLSVSHAKIGDQLMRQKDFAGAQAAYQASLVIRQTLVKHDPLNIEWQRDLFIGQSNAAVALMKQGDSATALKAFQLVLSTIEDLTHLDPTDTEWQRDLSITHEKIGDVLIMQGEDPRALAAFQESLAIMDDLAQRDPANSQWKVEVAECCMKLGSLKDQLSTSSRHAYLHRGREILVALSKAGQLHKNQDIIDQFDALAKSLGVVL
jgi:tetratricopeptide (TPR) repeat protein